MFAGSLEDYFWASDNSGLRPASSVSAGARRSSLGDDPTRLTRLPLRREAPVCGHGAGGCGS